MDARLHSPSLRGALSEGIHAAGGEVLLLGLCPSPLTYYSAYELDNIDGFVMVTGSHNPPDENGFKMGIGSDTLHSDDIQILGRMTSEAPEGPFGVGIEFEHYNIVDRYVNNMSSEFTFLKEYSVRPGGDRIKVVLDSGNGTAGPVLPPVMKAAGFEIIELFSEPDGNFPNHHPDPTLPETLDTLKRTVLENGADLGMAFDGDGDRIGVMDEKGDVVWGDMLLLLLARDLISRSVDIDENPPLIISEVKSSDLLYSGIKSAGGQALMWKTGHSLIKAKMKETGAVLAGEMSGHIFIADRYYGFDDAIYAAMRIVEVYSRYISEGTIKSFSDLLSDLPKVYSTPELRFPCADSLKFDMVGNLKDMLEAHISGENKPRIVNLIDVDGVRAEFEDGWGLLRASNTQPVLVMRFESSNAEYLKVYRRLFESILQELEGNREPS